MRRTRTLFALTALSLVAAAPASAGTTATPNSCKFNLDQTWRNGLVELSGVAAPNPAAPGSGVVLGQTAARIVLPEYLARAATDTTIFKAGPNEIRVKAWVAVEAPGTPQGAVVHPIDTVVRTTVATDADGIYVSSTPLDFTVALPDSSWTAPAAAFGFRQAGPGLIPPVPAGATGANVQPLGSAFIRAEVAQSGVVVLLDCQPAVGEGRATPAPMTAAAFETVAIDAGAAPIPAPRAAPAVALRSSKLKARGRAVKVALSCTVAECKGALTLKAGGRSLAVKRTYALKPGSRRTVTLRLTAAARKTLERKRTQKVTLRITATGGKTITKKLTLR